MQFFSRSRVRLAHDAIVLLAPLATLLSTGCLEGTAAQADSGTAADAAGVRSDTGSSHTADATPDVGTTSPDATMMHGPDATTASIPTCKGGTPTELACVKCDEMGCAPSVASAVAACSDFYSCFQACECTDATCVNACETKITAPCDNALTALASCQKGTCTAACAAPDAGQPADAAKVTDASAKSCTGATQTQKNCAACDEASCAADLSAAESACASFYQCLPTCACSDTACINNCETGASAACGSAATALSSCQTSMCSAACSGAGTDGGSSVPTVPNCAGATAAESMIYTACSACDATNCQSEVTAATKDCSAYYSCYAACACGDFLCDDACGGDLTGTCDADIDALATCQGTYCATPCSGE